MKIQSLSITFSIEKSRKEKATTAKLEKDIQTLENEINANASLNIQISLDKMRVRKLQK